MVGFQGESPADRRALEGAASRSFRDVQAMFKRVRESEGESVLRLARCFKQSNLALPAGGLSNPIVRMGRSPPPCPGFLGVEFTWSDIPVIPWKIQTYRFYMPV